MDDVKAAMAEARFAFRASGQETGTPGSGGAGGVVSGVTAGNTTAGLALTSGRPDLRDDGELARLVTRGDRSAAAVLIDRHQPAVFGFLRKLTGRPDLAEDLAQDTFVRLLKNAHRYDPQYPMRRWLLTIA